MDFEQSAKSKDYTKRVRQFIKDHILPIEKQHWDEIHSQRHGGDWKSWRIPDHVEKLKEMVKVKDEDIAALDKFVTPAGGSK